MSCVIFQNQSVEHFHKIVVFIYVVNRLNLMDTKIPIHASIRLLRSRRHFVIEASEHSAVIEGIIDTLQAHLDTSTFRDAVTRREGGKCLCFTCFFGLNFCGAGGGARARHEEAEGGGHQGGWGDKLSCLRFCSRGEIVSYKGEGDGERRGFRDRYYQSWVGAELIYKRIYKLPPFEKRHVLLENCPFCWI